MRALQEATRTIPIVFAAVSDPVGDGFVASIPAPGGNITGFMNFAPEVGGKWVQLLKEIAPRVARIGVLFNPETAPGRGAYFSSNIEIMTRSQAVRWAPVPVGAPGDIDGAIAGIAREPGGGLIVLPDSFTSVYRLAIVAAANHHKLPAIYPYRNFVTAGGLVASGSTAPIRCGGRRPMSIASSRARSQPSCRCRPRSNSRWRSTRALPICWASPSHPP